MTDQNAVNTSDTPVANAPKPKRAKRDSYSVTDLARARLRKRGVKTDDRLSDECKVVRGMLRSNFAHVVKMDANVRKAKSAPNDRKPWPTNMNAKVADMIVNGNKPSK